MTRKDYELIASVVATIADKDLRRSIANDFAAKLEDDNARFNPTTFRLACNVPIKL